MRRSTRRSSARCMTQSATAPAFARASPTRSAIKVAFGSPAYTTPSSSPVNRTSAPKTFRYLWTWDLWLWAESEPAWGPEEECFPSGACSAAVAGASVAIAILPLLNQIHEREHQNPHEVDEVPEEAADLDVVVVPVHVVAAEGSDEVHR